MIAAWVSLWARQEAPHALVAVRVLLGLVVLYDLLGLGWHGLVPVFFGPASEGGIAAALDRAEPPLVWTLLPEGPAAAWLWWGAMVACAAAFTAGLLTPAAAVALVLLWAQWAIGCGAVDRAVDRLCRNALLVLAFSGCGRAWSVDARLRTGGWRGAERIGAWGRYLLVAQIVVMYVTAGLFKTGWMWTPMGGYSALYVLLQDPSIQRFDFAFLGRQPFYLSTQVGSAVTVYWQVSYLAIPLLLHWRETAGRPGRLRALANRWHLDHLWIGIGAAFHVMLFVTCELGIFPFAMLALYPALFPPPRPAGGAGAQGGQVVPN